MRRRPSPRLQLLTIESVPEMHRPLASRFPRAKEGGGGGWGRKFAIRTFLEREIRALEKKQKEKFWNWYQVLNALNAQIFQLNISNRKIAICSGKDSKDATFNCRGKSTKENAAFKDSGEVQRGSSSGEKKMWGCNTLRLRQNAEKLWHQRKNRKLNCPSKGSKDDNSNRRRKSTKESAAFKESGEVLNSEKLWHQRSNRKLKCGMLRQKLKEWHRKLQNRKHKGRREMLSQKLKGCHRKLQNTKDKSRRERLRQKIKGWHR